tara:strand:+ start:1569 stop:2228 length:660 start_codon:yes stop_codon:yes gene_type:complete
MKKLKHKGSCDSAHKGKTHDEWEIEERNKEEEELEELVDYDGSLIGSKIPNNVNVANMTSKSTLDQTVDRSRQRGMSYDYYYKRYWGEAYLGGQLGADNDEDGLISTDGLGWDDTVEKYEDLGKTTRKAEDKAIEMGVIPNEEDIQMINEKSRQKMKDMIEMILAKRDEESDLGTPLELHDVNPLVKRKFKSLKSTIEADDQDFMEVINNLMKDDNAGH